MPREPDVRRELAFAIAAMSPEGRAAVSLAMNRDRESDLRPQPPSLNVLVELMLEYGCVARDQVPADLTLAEIRSG